LHKRLRGGQSCPFADLFRAAIHYVPVTGFFSRSPTWSAIPMGARPSTRLRMEQESWVKAFPCRRGRAPWRQGRASCGSFPDRRRLSARSAGSKGEAFYPRRTLPLANRQYAGDRGLAARTETWLGPRTSPPLGRSDRPHLSLHPLQRKRRRDPARRATDPAACHCAGHPREFSIPAGHDGATALRLAQFLAHRSARLEARLLPRRQPGATGRRPRGFMEVNSAQMSNKHTSRAAHKLI